MNTNDIKANEYILESLIHNAILNSVRWISRQCAPREPQEPDYIASLSIHLPKHIFNILKAVFPSHEFSVTGLYCHQKPIVDINTNKNPELGDLLLVYIDRYNGRKQLNSLLLQAKISASSVMHVQSNEAHQFQLYSKWPLFKYLKAGYLNGQTRNILPKTINDGAQYLLIDNNPYTNGLAGLPGTYPMGCAVPSNPLCINNNLSEEMVDFLKFKSGRAFEVRDPNCIDDWSKMIWDLLDITSHAYSKRKNANINQLPRKNKCVTFVSEGFPKTTLMDELSVEHSDMKWYDDSSNDNIGISTIIIESSNGIEQG